jgi:hypothetical protein
MQESGKNGEAVTSRLVLLLVLATNMTKSRSQTSQARILSYLVVFHAFGATHAQFVRPGAAPQLLPPGPWAGAWTAGLLRENGLTGQLWGENPLGRHTHTNVARAPAISSWGSRSGTSAGTTSPPWLTDRQRSLEKANVRASEDR